MGNLRIVTAIVVFISGLATVPALPRGMAVFAGAGFHAGGLHAGGRGRFVAGPRRSVSRYAARPYRGVRGPLRDARYLGDNGYVPLEDATAAPAGSGAYPEPTPLPASEIPPVGGRVDEHGLPYNPYPDICFWQRKANEFVRACK
jgi:hypothetical protein